MTGWRTPYRPAMSNAHTLSSVVPESEHVAYPNGELAQICGELAAVFRRAWGRGPAKTSAHWAGPNMLVVLLANGHTRQSYLR